MTPRERFLSAITGRQTDRLPTQIDFTPLAAEQAAGWLGVEVANLPLVLGNHVMSVYAGGKVRMEGTTAFDLWGIGWDSTINDGFQVDVNPLADLKALSTYRFPDPDDPRHYSFVLQKIGQNDGQMAVAGEIGFCLWERYYLLRGFERAMEDLVAEPALVEDLLDSILEVQIGIARSFTKLKIDLGYTGDDFGSQRGLLYSPDTWRKYFKPRYKELWGAFKARGLPVNHHTCGDVRPILDDLIEIGLDILCPVQTSAMPPEELADRWGDRLAFWGGISTQDVLPFGTPANVLAEIARCKATLGRRGRYLIGPSHALTSDVTRENFFAMLEGLQIEPARVS